MTRYRGFQECDVASAEDLLSGVAKLGSQQSVLGGIKIRL